MKAFPNIELTVSEMGQIRKVYENNPGMDLRDYFAAKALPIYLARFGSSEGYTQLHTCELASEWSYAMADAMMEARK